MTDYLVYDVFTDAPFGGNPLAVIPDATGLAEDQLQRIAREFNFSETTFVYPPADPAHDAKVRIFTPTSELAFAGHPTIGTSVALSDLGRGGPDMVLELGVGPIPCHVTGKDARFETRVPLKRENTVDPGVIAACIGLDEASVRTKAHAPEVAGVGTAFVLAELMDRVSLAQASPVTDGFRTLAEQVGRDGVRASLLVYLRTGSKIEARMFAPLSNIPEDPATGSAAAALVALLGALDGSGGDFDISQGVDMGRPSRIGASVVVEDGRPVAVTISGSAVKVMEGRLTL